MARIAGIDIPREKKIPYSLCYIHGIGLTTAIKICTEAKQKTKQIYLIHSVTYSIGHDKRHK